MEKENGDLGKVTFREKQLEDLKFLWQRMADHTKSKCGPPTCRGAGKNRCCDRLYCEIAKNWAKEVWQVELEETDHPELPFMGPEGCTVAPHLRPNCTFHQCRINGLGFLPEDEEWTRQYFYLRAKIERLEFKLKIGHRNVLENSGI